MGTEKEIKERIQRVLSENDLNPTRLAKTTGANQKTLNNQINGDTALSLSIILLIADTLPNLSLEWLLRGKGEPYNDIQEQKYVEICKKILENRRNEAAMFKQLDEMLENMC